MQRKEEDHHLLRPFPLVGRNSHCKKKWPQRELKKKPERESLLLLQNLKLHLLQQDLLLLNWQERSKQKKKHSDEQMKKRKKKRELEEARKKATAAAAEAQAQAAKAAAQASAPVSSGPITGNLEFTTSGNGAKGGPNKKLIIFTVTFTVDGKKVTGSKEDLIVYVDGPTTPTPRVNVMGGTGGAYHIGFTPSEAGQHWVDFIFKGNWSAEPFCLAIKDNFNKTPDFPYTGSERKAK